MRDLSSRTARRLQLEFLETRNLLAGAPITGFGIAGDSLSDEYAVETYSYARNWDELLAQEKGLNFGPQGNYAEPRRAGYAYNWARYGGDSSTLLTDGQHTKLAAQINAGQVSHAVLAIGQNDFAPDSEAYFAIAKQLYTAQQIEDYSNLVVSNITTALTTLYNTNAYLAMSNIADYGVAPATQENYTPTEQQRVTVVIEAINDRVETLADKYNVPLLDLNGVSREFFGGNFAPTPSLEVGGVTINNADGVAATNAFVDDGIHPHTVVQSQIANLILTTFQRAYATPVSLFTEAQAVQAAGLTYGGSNTLNLPFADYVRLPGNVAPNLSSIAATSNHTENAAARLVATTGVVSDADNLNFARGALSVRISANANTADRLRIIHSGNAAGQIGVSGSNVSYGGVKIGTFTGGNGSTALNVALNNKATKTAVQALLRRVGFQTISEAPSTAIRTLAFTLADGDGKTSPAVTSKVTVTAKNDAPKLTGISGSIGYVRNAPSKQVAGSATISDIDSKNFFNGRLLVQFGSGAKTGDVLSLGGVFTVDANRNVLRSGVKIGALNQNGGKYDGTKFVPLTVTFTTTSVTPSIAQELVRSVRFKTASAAGARGILFSISDGDGGVSAKLTKTINVT